ncbi:unnamed protein product, partial [Porites evermanni]
KDAFANAVEDCKSYLDESDGEILSSWLLCEIDHWDHEKERIVLITKKTLCLVKYNFSGLKFDGVRKVPLIECNKIQIGRFVYPKTTMMIGNDVMARLPAHMQLDQFQQAIIQAITEAHNALQEGVAMESLEIAHNSAILIEVYCGFSPILHNYGILGFNRDRGKFGF